jgi:hypothetical protein
MCVNVELTNWIREALTRIKVISGKPKDLIIDKNMITSCLYCEEEYGISQYDVEYKSGFKISHGYCIRHIPRYLAVMFGTKNTKQYEELVHTFLIRAIMRFNKNNGKKEPKDLSLLENKLILNWFKNPIPLS